jgi:hypothetical protein
MQGCSRNARPASRNLWEAGPTTEKLQACALAQCGLGHEPDSAVRAQWLVGLVQEAQRFDGGSAGSPIWTIAFSLFASLAAPKQPR